MWFCHVLSTSCKFYLWNLDLYIYMNVIQNTSRATCSGSILYACIRQWREYKRNYACTWWSCYWRYSLPIVACCSTWYTATRSCVQVLEIQYYFSNVVSSHISSNPLCSPHTTLVHYSRILSHRLDEDEDKARAQWDNIVEVGTDSIPLNSPKNKLIKIRMKIFKIFIK